MTEPGNEGRDRAAKGIVANGGGLGRGEIDRWHWVAVVEHHGGQAEWVDWLFTRAEAVPLCSTTATRRVCVGAKAVNVRHCVLRQSPAKSPHSSHKLLQGNQ